MTTPKKIEIAIDGIEIIAEAMRSVGNQMDVAAESARQFVAEWNRFKNEVPHQTGELRR